MIQQRWISLACAAACAVSCGGDDEADFDAASVTSIVIEPAQVEVRADGPTIVRVFAVDEGGNRSDVTEEATLAATGEGITAEPGGSVSGSAPGFGALHATWKAFAADAPVRVNGWISSVFAPGLATNGEGDAMTSVLADGRVAIVTHDAPVRVTFFDPWTGFGEPEPAGDAAGVPRGISYSPDGRVVLVVDEGDTTPALAALERDAAGTWTRIGALAPDAQAWRLSRFGAHPTGGEVAVLYLESSHQHRVARRSGSSWASADLVIDDYIHVSRLFVDPEGTARFAVTPLNIKPSTIALHRATRDGALDVAFTVPALAADSSIDCPQLDVDDEGRGVIAWLEYDPSYNGTLRFAEIAGDAIVGGPYAVPGPVSNQCDTPLLARDGQGVATMMFVQKAPDLERALTLVRLAPGSEPGAPERIDDGNHVTSAHFAVAADGNAYFLWYTSDYLLRHRAPDGALDPVEPFSPPLHVSLPRSFQGTQSGVFGMMSAYDNPDYLPLAMVYFP